MKPSPINHITNFPSGTRRKQNGNSAKVLGTKEGIPNNGYTREDKTSFRFSFLLKNGKNRQYNSMNPLPINYIKNFLSGRKTEAIGNNRKKPATAFYFLL